MSYWLYTRKAMRPFDYGTRVRLLCNGYIDPDAGSVSSGSFLVLEELLARGHEVTFVSKRAFMYPAGLLARYANLRFVDATNRRTDCLHERVGRRVPLLASLTGPINHGAFIRLVLRRMRVEAGRARFDAALFLGLSPPRPVDGVPTVCWVQGPPGTDVRSLERHRAALVEVEGWRRSTLLRVYGWAKLRFDSAKPFRRFAAVVVGSRWAAQSLCQRFGADPSRTMPLAYPIDLSVFTSRPSAAPSAEPLRVLWLGRIVPRKRLDLLLDAAIFAERAGTKVALTIVGSFTFAPGLRKLIERYAHPERLAYLPSICREQVPALLGDADVLCQPSDEENFGSSVAEAMACGTPVIVGQTNGTADYIDAHSIHLNSDDPIELAGVFADLADRKRKGTLINSAATRAVAEQNFDVCRIADRLETVLGSVGSSW